MFFCTYTDSKGVVRKSADYASYKEAAESARLVATTRKVVVTIHRPSAPATPKPEYPAAVVATAPVAAPTAKVARKAKGGAS